MRVVRVLHEGRAVCRIEKLGSLVVTVEREL